MRRGEGLARRIRQKRRHGTQIQINRAVNPHGISAALLRRLQEKLPLFPGAQQLALPHVSSPIRYFDKLMKISGPGSIFNRGQKGVAVAFEGKRLERRGDGIRRV